MPITRRRRTFPVMVNPVADGLTPAELAYDAHGNTTTLADQSLEFDLGNRHLSTT